ncbi:MAG: hypothetical protein M3277_12100 [Actinomycetota bacterium]|nr:hypothetical protein [Actinomycetota bacterium]
MKQPGLRNHLEQALGPRDFTVDPERVEKVVLKLARGHAMFELSEPQYEVPTSIGVAVLNGLSTAERAAFESPPALTVSPEVGSRAMQRTFKARSVVWIDVQPGRYRYLAATGGAVTVRMVLSEFVAAEVIWDSTSDGRM